MSVGVAGATGRCRSASLRPWRAVPVGPCEGYRSTANTWQTVAVASFVASGVAATGGVALWLLASRPSKGAAVWPPPLACGAGVGSLACVGRF